MGGDVAVDGDVVGNIAVPWWVVGGDIAVVSVVQHVTYWPNKC